MSIEVLQSEMVLGDISAEENYLSALDNRLLGLVNASRVTFESVVTYAGGAFPTVVLDRLRYLNVLPRLSTEHNKVLEAPSILYPELHALDFEWYFTAGCAQNVARILHSYRGDVLCMGAPTIAAALVHLGEKPMLLDNSSLIRDRLSSEINQLEFVRCDLNGSCSVGRKFPIVFFDGPWYEDYTLSWLWQAAQMVTPGGLIAFSLFPSLLRPGAADERVRILNQASAIGDLDLLEQHLSYETPLFESEALAASGITMRTNWRRGDLVLLRVTKQTGFSRPVKRSNTDDHWDSYILGPQVIKLRRQKGREYVPILSPVTGSVDFIFSSVSLREARRPEIGVWTSRNRVAVVNKPNLIATILSQLTRGLELSAVLKSENLSTVDRQCLLTSLPLILDSRFGA